MSHEFAMWMRQQDNPIYAEFVAVYGDFFLPTGDREALRAVVEVGYRKPKAANEHDALAVFDTAWREFHPFCEAPDCRQVVGEHVSLCDTHAAMAELL